ncbi:hypothetical protein ALC62_01272 [Cyphomyrmex costatus]|uniref:Uncharacterized protein n=1 Tax=Cyphomyrmex costatus TaxID=456900 RepID=A0A195D4J3_9HYME|nr:hypothetical protein ALC62_01272 [Cyphomyrmex costatus]
MRSQSQRTFATNASVVGKGQGRGTEQSLVGRVDRDTTVVDGNSRPRARQVAFGRGERGSEARRLISTCERTRRGGGGENPRGFRSARSAGSRCRERRSAQRGAPCASEAAGSNEERNVVVRQYTSWCRHAGSRLLDQMY